MKLQRFLTALLAGPVVCSAMSEENWPRWRGPNADGVADSRKLPLRWSKTKNIGWSARLPGWGTSSPVVHGDRVFVTSEADENGNGVPHCRRFDVQSGINRVKQCCEDWFNQNSQAQACQ